MAEQALVSVTVSEALLTGCGWLTNADGNAENLDLGSNTLDLDSANGGSNSMMEKQQQQHNNVNGMAEIDTSAPFESVKEAATRFGGFGFWRPSLSPVVLHDAETTDAAKLEEQTAQLEKDLTMKERETLVVLKELEATKMVAEKLNAKLQNELSEVNVHDPNSDHKNVVHGVTVGEKESHANDNQNSMVGLGLCPSSAPGFILMELKRAKLNLSRTTNDIVEIQAAVESFSKQIEKERISLEKTRQRLSSNSLKIVSLEEELNQTTLKLQLFKGGEVKSVSDDPMDIPRELQRLSSEAEQLKKIGEAAKSEVARAMSEIEQTKTRIKTAEIRLVAAKKMKEAVRASEAVALAEIKDLSNSESSSGVLQQKSEGVTHSLKEYSSLTAKAREAEEVSKGRVIDAMVQVDDANVSNAEILKRVEEATEEVKSSRKVLEEALNRVKTANEGKLAVEEASRKWRSEHGQKRCTVHNSTKFKNSGPTLHRKDSRLLDVNGLNLVNDEVQPVLKQTVSIGQILSRKLLLTEDYENGMPAEKVTGKQKVSLAQMLSKPNVDLRSARKGGKENQSSHKQLPIKRKKFGFARTSLLVTKQSKKKKRQSTSSSCQSP